MLTKGIKVFEYVRLCQVSFLLRGHVLRFAQRATDTSSCDAFELTEKSIFKILQV